VRGAGGGAAEARRGRPCAAPRGGRAAPRRARGVAHRGARPSVALCALCSMRLVLSAPCAQCALCSLRLVLSAPCALRLVLSALVLSAPCALCALCSLRRPARLVFSGGGHCFRRGRPVRGSGRWSGEGRRGVRPDARAACTCLRPASLCGRRRQGPDRRPAAARRSKSCPGAAWQMQCSALAATACPAKSTARHQCCSQPRWLNVRRSGRRQRRSGAGRATVAAAAACRAWPPRSTSRKRHAPAATASGRTSRTPAASPPRTASASWSWRRRDAARRRGGGRRAGLAACARRHGGGGSPDAFRRAAAPQLPRLLLDARLQPQPCLRAAAVAHPAQAPHRGARACAARGASPRDTGDCERSRACDAGRPATLCRGCALRRGGRL